MDRTLTSIDKSVWITLPKYSQWTVLNRHSMEVIYQTQSPEEAVQYVNKKIADNEDDPIMLTKDGFYLVRHYSRQMGSPEHRSFSPEQMSWQILYDHENEEQKNAYFDIGEIMFDEHWRDPNWIPS